MPPADPGPAGDEIARFALALRQARRRSGDPSYRMLAHRMDYSPATISRMFDGRNFPRWEQVQKLLDVLGVPRDQVNTDWRERWITAVEQRRPVGLAPSDAGPAPAADKPEDPPGPRPGGNRAADPGQPPGQACEDCGSWVVNLVQHQAWHWSIERQIRRAVMHAVDGGNASGRPASRA